MKKKKNEKNLTNDEILKMALNVASKTIGADIEPLKYEDIPNELAEILSKCLKDKVEVSGNGLDGNDMVVKVEKLKNFK